MFACFKATVVRKLQYNNYSLGEQVTYYLGNKTKKKA